MLGLLAQIKTFFLTLLLGLLAGIIFHYYQLTIRSLQAGKYVLYLLDLFLWIIMILLISLGMLLINQGELRIYFFLILLAGSFIYFKLLAGSLERPLKVLAQASATMLRFIGASLFKPLKWLQYAVKRIWQHRHSSPPPDDNAE